MCILRAGLLAGLRALQRWGSSDDDAFAEEEEWRRSRHSTSRAGAGGNHRERGSPPTAGGTAIRRRRPESAKPAERCSLPSRPRGCCQESFRDAASQPPHLSAVVQGRLAVEYRGELRQEFFAACGVLRARLAPLLEPSTSRQKYRAVTRLKAVVGGHLAVVSIQSIVRRFNAKLLLARLGAGNLASQTAAASNPSIRLQSAAASVPASCPRPAASSDRATRPQSAACSTGLHASRRCRVTIDPLEGGDAAGGGGPGGCGRSLGKQPLAVCDGVTRRTSVVPAAARFPLGGRGVDDRPLHNSARPSIVPPIALENVGFGVPCNAPLGNSQALGRSAWLTTNTESTVIYSMLVHPLAALEAKPTGSEERDAEALASMCSTGTLVRPQSAGSLGAQGRALRGCRCGSAAVRRGTSQGSQALAKRCGQGQRLKNSLVPRTPPSQPRRFGGGALAIASHGNAVDGGGSHFAEQFLISTKAASAFEWPPMSSAAFGLRPKSTAAAAASEVSPNAAAATAAVGPRRGIGAGAGDTRLLPDLR